MDSSSFDTSQFNRLTQEEKDKQLLDYTNRGETEKVSELIEVGANINSAENGHTALISAALKSHAAIVALLIKAGANLNTVNITGKTALMVAAWYNQTDVITDLLIKAGANLDIATRDGETALLLAINGNHDATAFRLLSAMSAEQIKAALLANPSLKTTMEGFNKAVLDNQKKMFSLFGAGIIKEDNEAFLTGMEPDLIASHLSQHLPLWYAPRVESDVKLVWGVMCKMKDNRKALEESQAVLPKFSALSVQDSSFLPSFSGQPKGEIKENEAPVNKKKQKVTQ